MVSMITTLLPAILQILSETPQFVEDVKAIWALASAKTPPTADEQSQYDAALEEAHKALQAS